MTTTTYSPLENDVATIQERREPSPLLRPAPLPTVERLAMCYGTQTPRENVSVITVDGSTVSVTGPSLSSLRVRTLKAIAQHLGVKCGGKKADLVQRIVDHAVTAGPAALKGLEIDTSQPAGTTGNGRGRGRKGRTSTATSAEHDVAETETESSSRRPPSNLPVFFPFRPNHPDAAVGLRNCLCGGSTPFWPGPAISCTTCECRLHAPCMRWDTSIEPAGGTLQFLCPACRLRQLDPFFSPVDLLWVSYIHAGQPNASILATKDGDSACVMGSTAVVSAHDLRSWRRRNYEVVVRCVRLGTPDARAKQLHHEWPRTLDLRIHNSVESVLAPRPDHKRRDSPVIITHYLKPGDNLVEIVATELVNATDGSSAAYALGILLCQSNDVPAIADMVKSATAKSETFEGHRDRVTRLLNPDRVAEDDDVACMETNRKMRLTCPITLTRMTVPTRGRECQHLQCFDLESYVTVTKNSKAFNNRWRCPECPLVLRPADLVVDQFVQRVLKNVGDDPDATTVELSHTGGWHVAAPLSALHEEEEEEDEGPPVLPTVGLLKRVPTTVEILDDTDEATPPEPASRKRMRALSQTDDECEANRIRPKRQCIGPTPEDIIDLSPSTSSSSTDHLSQHPSPPVPSWDSPSHPMPRRRTDDDEDDHEGHGPPSYNRSGGTQESATASDGLATTTNAPPPPQPTRRRHQPPPSDTVGLFMNNEHYQPCSTGSHVEDPDILAQRAAALLLLTSQCGPKTSQQPDVGGFCLDRPSTSDWELLLQSAFAPPPASSTAPPPDPCSCPCPKPSDPGCPSCGDTSPPPSMSQPLGTRHAIAPAVQPAAEDSLNLAYHHHHRARSMSASSSPPLVPHLNLPPLQVAWFEPLPIPKPQRPSPPPSVSHDPAPIGTPPTPLPSHPSPPLSPPTTTFQQPRSRMSVGTAAGGGGRPPGGDLPVAMRGVTGTISTPESQHTNNLMRKSVASHYVPIAVAPRLQPSVDDAEEDQLNTESLLALLSVLEDTTSGRGGGGTQQPLDPDMVLPQEQHLCYDSEDTFAPHLDVADLDCGQPAAAAAAIGRQHRKSPPPVCILPGWEPLKLPEAPVQDHAPDHRGCCSAMFIDVLNSARPLRSSHQTAASCDQ